MCMCVFERERERVRERGTDRQREYGPREATHNLILGHEGARVVILQSLLMLLSTQMAQQVDLGRNLSESLW